MIPKEPEGTVEPGARRRGRVRSGGIFDGVTQFVGNDTGLERASISSVIDERSLHWQRDARLDAGSYEILIGRSSDDSAHRRIALAPDVASGDEGTIMSHNIQSVGG